MQCDHYQPSAYLRPEPCAANCSKLVRLRYPDVASLKAVARDLASLRVHFCLNNEKDSAFAASTLPLPCPSDESATISQAMKLICDRMNPTDVDTSCAEVNSWKQ